VKPVCLPKRTSWYYFQELSINLEQLNKLWEFPVDNGFANNLFRDPKTSEASIRGSRAAKLCDKCLKLDFWEPRFRIKDTLSELEDLSRNCDFCKMRWDLSKHLNPEEFPSIQFDRLESMLRINERYPPALTICRSPGMYFSNQPIAYQHDLF
jgi:hypothetical protein